MPKLHIKGIVHLKCPLHIDKVIEITEAQRTGFEKGIKKELLSYLLAADYPAVKINMNEIKITLIP